MTGQPHYFQDVFGQLAMLGVDPHDLVPNYEHEGGGRVVLALPESRVALAVEGDTPEPLEEDGWHVTRATAAQLQAFSSGYSLLSLLGLEHVRRNSQSRMLKSGSKEEQWLLDGILAAQLPEPDRNLVIRRDNGTELTVPDFAWADLKLAFFVDGLWWHVSKDDTQLIADLKEVAQDGDAAASLMEGNRTRAERDGNNRSELVMDGWRVLSCTDRDLAADGGVDKQVERITRLMRSIIRDRAQKPQQPVVGNVSLIDII